ncbi:MAG: YchJ family metal-binding protein [Rubrivivax sp.]|nr:YchJ family metal-binding protein [Rubrivivax sp.]MDH5338908.1 YchJ family metal-binding protein [Rubrivivax sp.]
MDANAPCPCGAGRPYGRCCGRWHAGPQTPADAEALMRSRYSAYVLGLTAYLRATWAPENCPPRIDADPPGLKWLGLEVRRLAVLDADHATVEFVARSKLAGRAQRLHEVSRFERRDGRWLYVDGEIVPTGR